MAIGDGWGPKEWGEYSRMKRAHEDAEKYREDRNYYKDVYQKICSEFDAYKNAPPYHEMTLDVLDG